jgi:hypothetical protein
VVHKAQHVSVVVVQRSLSLIADQTSASAPHDTRRSAGMRHVVSSVA